MKDQINLPELKLNLPRLEQLKSRYAELYELYAEKETYISSHPHDDPSYSRSQMAIYKKEMLEIDCERTLIYLHKIKAT